MDHSDGRFTAKDGLSLYYQCWLPDAAIKAILVAVHGFTDHSGRYGNLVNHLVPRGYGVYGFDLRGHGNSEGARCHIRRFSDFVEDLGLFLDIVRSRHPGTKIYLYGHSGAATIALTYVLPRQESISGLIFTGALLDTPRNATPLLKLAARILSVIIPRAGAYAIDANRISRDKNVVQAFMDDPLVHHGKISARLGAELLDALAIVNRRLSEIRVPLLVMHGTSDLLSPPENSRRIFEGASSAHKTLRLYDGLYHGIINEPGREQVLADIDSWLDSAVRRAD